MHVFVRKTESKERSRVHESSVLNRKVGKNADDDVAVTVGPRFYEVLPLFHCYVASLKSDWHDEIRKKMTFFNIPQSPCPGN